MTQRQSVKRRRLFGVGLSVVVHALVLLALVQAQMGPRKAPDPQPVAVRLVEMPRPPDPAPPQQQPRPSPKKPPPRRMMVKPAPAPPDIEPLPAGKGPTGDGVAEIGEAELAGAGTAGSGGGGACNMIRWLQAALRKDRLVQAAVADAHRGKAIMVWNGDWIRRSDQDGAGLAAVREAIMWEVAFAPAACRAEKVHGLILISMNDSQGSARLVVGAGDWRWSDLLFSGRAGPRETFSR